MKPIVVVMAGGGTGGHLFPAIAVARELLRRQPDARVTFAGTARGLEMRIVPREGFELDVIRSAGIKGKSVTARARGAALIPVGLADAWRILSRRRPHVVIGVGGYSSGPVVLAAALRGIPTMVLEQNAVPGLTNRTLAPWVRTAAVTYQETLRYFRGKGFVSGNPVRPEFVRAADRPRANAEREAPRVLVLGGSQGSHAINMAVVRAATEWAKRRGDFALVHQTGERDLATVRTAYEKAGLGVRTEAFLDDVAGEMTAAALVIGRAGSTTLAELAAVGTPAVLVPFAAATDDHQRRNATVLADAGAAVVIDEADLSGRRLADEVNQLLDDPARLEAMGLSMRGFARPQAAATIVDKVIELANG
jgi:UDP-N-acetylglucosamine--N-acetylmuramyl-(pentapeptide) pyrophosphoryl-undecaprenol N-acetylglucosamine transferase